MADDLSCYSSEDNCSQRSSSDSPELSQRSNEVLSEVTTEETLEDNEVEAEAPKKPKNKGKKKTINKFKEDDRHDVNVIVEGLSSTIDGIGKCATSCFTGFTGAQHKKEKKSGLKKFHKVTESVVGAKLKVGMVKEIVGSVYEDMDLEGIAEGKEVDDEGFFGKLEEFEKKCMREMERRFAEVTVEEIDKDEQYQEILEILNQFVDRKNTGVEPEEAAGPSVYNPPRTKQEVEYSEGLEALNEFIPLRCPLSLKYFTDPYVNRVCGHVYELASVVELESGLMRCPVAGCTNDKPVDAMVDLVKDKELERKILERIRMDGLD